MIYRIVERDIGAEIPSDQIDFVEFHLLDELVEPRRLVCDRMIDLLVLGIRESIQVGRNHLIVTLADRAHHVAPHQRGIRSEAVDEDHRLHLGIAAVDVVGHQAFIEADFLLADAGPSQFRRLHPSQNADRAFVERAEDDRDDDRAERPRDVEPCVTAALAGDQLAANFGLAAAPLEFLGREVFVASAMREFRAGRHSDYGAGDAFAAGDATDAGFALAVLLDSSDFRIEVRGRSTTLSSSSSSSASRSFSICSRRAEMRSISWVASWTALAA